MLDAAVRAFTDGLQVVAGTGAVVALAMAVVAAVLLRPGGVRAARASPG